MINIINYLFEYKIFIIAIGVILLPPILVYFVHYHNKISFSYKKDSIIYFENENNKKLFDNLNEKFSISKPNTQKIIKRYFNKDIFKDLDNFEVKIEVDYDYKFKHPNDLYTNHNLNYSYITVKVKNNKPNQYNNFNDYLYIRKIPIKKLNEMLEELSKTDILN